MHQSRWHPHFAVPESFLGGGAATGGGALVRKGFDVSSVSSEGLAKGFVDASMPGESADGNSSAVEDAGTATAAAAAGRAL